MHRIDTSTAQVDKFGAGKNGFTGGNPQTGELPTALDETFFDSVQEEIAAVIEAAGIELSKNSNIQLLSALRTSFSAGRLLNVQTFTSSGTYTPTPGTNLIIVEGIGGGGAGGGAPVTLSGNVGFGCGGHAGAYGKARFTISEIGASQTISIGAGGVASTGAGGNGGNSTLGSLIIFGGGAGGPRVGNTAPPLIAGNGNPSAATSISANLIRGYGQNSTVGVALSTAAIYSSAGASSSYGSGGSSVNTTGNGQSASGFGAGGSGACAQSGNATERLGGNGSPGFITIYEYA